MRVVIVQGMQTPIPGVWELVEETGDLLGDRLRTKQQLRAVIGSFRLFFNRQN